MSSPLTKRVEALESHTPEVADAALAGRVGSLEQSSIALKTEFAGLRNDVSSLRMDVEGTNKELRLLTNAVTQQGAAQQQQVAMQGRFDIRTLITVVMAMVALGGIGWGANRMQTQADLSPQIQRITAVEKTVENISDSVARLAAASAVSEETDAQSKTDRSNINSFIQRQMDLNSSTLNLLTELKAMFVESETQQRSNSQIRNLMIDHGQQLLAILWQEVKGVAMPKNGYFPDISLPKPQHSK